MSFYSSCFLVKDWVGKGIVGDIDCYLKLKITLIAPNIERDRHARAKQKSKACRRWHIPLVWRTGVSLEASRIRPRVGNESFTFFGGILRIPTKSLFCHVGQDTAHFSTYTCDTENPVSFGSMRTLNNYSLHFFKHKDRYCDPFILKSIL